MGAITTEEMEQSINRLLSLSSFAIVPRVIAGLGYHEEQSYNFVKVIDHECDLLCITNSGYLTEIEIKISVSDLRADFKKKKKDTAEILSETFIMPFRNICSKRHWN